MTKEDLSTDSKAGLTDWQAKCNRSAARLVFSNPGITNCEKVTSSPRLAAAFIDVQKENVFRRAANDHIVYPFKAAKRTGFLIAASDKSTNNGLSLVRSFDLNLFKYATENANAFYTFCTSGDYINPFSTDGSFCNLFADSSRLAKIAVATSFRTFRAIFWLVHRLYCPSSASSLLSKSLDPCHLNKAK
ncbi:hypothetical protein HELRODRAFT_174173 [Helobdella robusta]|uniref:Uncharacterized protein n=1 Tax=Helobdella robusta TaxID=6412 RepID=T1F7Q8_HELRO|nr:hypothetical protein HELRODRAFT_174173 [Helobdella robusta]ESO02766.1 hypothetical protein HELRODRAFT_174173 [Helobdella robusta]